MCGNACEIRSLRATLSAVMVVAVLGQVSERSAAALVGTQITDPANERTIYIAAGGLLLLAIALGVGTLWWWRTSKVEHPALGPLEVMGTRSWWRGDWTARSRRLDAARPTAPGPVGADEDEVDLQALATGSPLPFDDLTDAPPASPAVSMSLEELVASLDAESPAAGPAPVAESAPAAVVVDEKVGNVAPPARAPIDPLLRPPPGD